MTLRDAKLIGRSSYARTIAEDQPGETVEIELKMGNEIYSNVSSLLKKRLNNWVELKKQTPPILMNLIVHISLAPCCHLGSNVFIEVQWFFFKYYTLKRLNGSLLLIEMAL